VTLNHTSHGSSRCVRSQYSLCNIFYEQAKISPSYAAVTGTIDRTGMIHMMHVQAQEKAQRGAAEIVKDLDFITEKMLRQFGVTANQQAPQKNHCISWRCRRGSIQGGKFNEELIRVKQYSRYDEFSATSLIQFQSNFRFYTWNCGQFGPLVRNFHQPTSRKSRLSPSKNDTRRVSWVRISTVAL